jgi:acyl-CoA thioester hydrolase
MAERVKTFRVQWGDTDAAAIVFYPNYYRWFDAATHDLFRSLGYPVSRMLDDGFAVPLVEAQAQFRFPLRYDDEVTLLSRVVETRVRTFRVEHTVSRGEEVCCEGYEERIWVRVHAGGIIEAEPIPDGVRALISDGA